VVLKEIWWKNGTGLIWIRIIKSGGLLWILRWSCWFHKILQIPRVIE
jgi:hypothetical protein